MRPIKCTWSEVGYRASGGRHHIVPTLEILVLPDCHVSNPLDDRKFEVKKIPALILNTFWYYGLQIVSARLPDRSRQTFEPSLRNLVVRYIYVRGRHGFLAGRLRRSFGKKPSPPLDENLLFLF